MPIDIHQLDHLDQESSSFERKSEKFIETLLEQFFEAPEGQLHLEAHPDAGFWVEQFLAYGLSHIGAVVSRMSVHDARELVFEIFPRKISLQAPEEADAAIPELLAFWRYLQREYKLANAEPILKWLRDNAPQFRQTMFDPRRFGLAKSFVMLGQAEGYDMTNKRDIDAFMLDYNARILAQQGAMAENKVEEGAEEEDFEPLSSSFGQQRQPSRKALLKKKNKRKMAAASRKKNRRKK